MPSFRTLAAAEALTWMFDAVEHDRPYSLFDMRDTQSYERGHMPGAQPLSERELDRWIGRLPKHRPILVYCYHGNASRTIAQAFADFGHTEVYSVDGGFHALAHAWQHARAALRGAA